ncbi:hypothetical protein B9Z51_00445 [Limnohabitans sp. T6-5]|uniref:Imm49 family immunity protein n=1 Tax=Limnohabitans sp. T6-5 TaxID=1100724 RepID=UPI000D37F732|nr:Imm49 family immunity protein [Limnohabitans sp. T6-5]PUE10858.1 hypothetical protein B9Z51_00445 [Limnohabitans sp. T6-5]
MNTKQESREEWLVSLLERIEQHEKDQLDSNVNDYHKLRWGSVLSGASYLPRYQGLRSFFINNDLHGLKQNFYVVCKLLMASEKEAEPGGDPFATYVPFLYGLLSDSTEIYDWLAHAELKEKDEVKTPHFLFHQFQLVLLRDDDALRETIALVAKKGGNQKKAIAQAGQDFFSLLLKQDKESLQALIENQAKIKSVDDLEDQFLAAIPAVHAKLCWYRGIEVQIQNPLVPMGLMPIEPLDTYDVEYDFLRPGWTPPPPPGLFAKVKRLFL